MFFFFPWGTDAPLYHWPIATVSLIATNALVFAHFTLSRDPGAAMAWSLWIGQGLHPVQWITSNFIHGDVGHVLGNMAFLWVFGLVVEGKVGLLRFLAIYFGIGIVQCALEQSITLGMPESFSFGASSIVYGLMAISLVWAPKNDIHFITGGGWGFRSRSSEFDVPVMWLAVFYVCMDLLVATFTGFELQTAVLHLMGASLGLVVGWVMLKRAMVDCEGWDIINVWHGREGRSTLDDRTPSLTEEQRTQIAAREAESARQKIVQLVAQRQGRLAALFYQQKARALPGWQLPEAELVELIRAVDHADSYDVAVPILVEYLERFPAKALHVRLKLAQILLATGARPRQALRVLSKLPTEPLSPKLEALRRELISLAKRQEADGVMELAVEDW
ncbi:MAG: rhomboid family intramembrane serine protease [Pirellulales bacterium]|nr:rhomboid family intramembrane serine protease [Pirellulales bacterium]